MSDKDLLLLGLFLVVFSQGISRLIVIVWSKIHEPSLAWLNQKLGGPSNG